MLSAKFILALLVVALIGSFIAPTFILRWVGML